MSDMKPKPDKYDKKACKEIVAFRNKEQSRFSKALEIAATPLSKTTELVLEKTPVGKATEGIVSLVNDLAAPTVRHKAIQVRFREHGHDVTKASDIRNLKLESIDEVVGNLQTKYVAALGAEGVALGAAGVGGPGLAAAAIITDLLATVGGGLRAVGEYGAYYGYPVTNQLEAGLRAESPPRGSYPGRPGEACRVRRAHRRGKDGRTEKDMGRAQQARWCVSGSLREPPP